MGRGQVNQRPLFPPLIPPSLVLITSPLLPFLGNPNTAKIQVVGLGNVVEEGWIHRRVGV